MITVQGPLITDRYTKPSPKETYTLWFYNRDIILWETELDFNPSKEQIRDIWNTEVKPLYPKMELF